MWRNAGSRYDITDTCPKMSKSVLPAHITSINACINLEEVVSHVVFVVSYSKQSSMQQQRRTRLYGVVPACAVRPTPSLNRCQEHTSWSHSQTAAASGAYVKSSTGGVYQLHILDQRSRVNVCRARFTWIGWHCYNIGSFPLHYPITRVLQVLVACSISVVA